MKSILVSGLLFLLALSFSPMPASCASEGKKVLFIGDSLTAGYELAEQEAYPAIIERLAAQEGIKLNVGNAGVSGDTSAGALRRLNWLLQEEYDMVVIEIGANDGLRGLSLTQLRQNLQKIIEKLKVTLPSASIVLLGLRLPLNFGASYTQEFEKIYQEVAKQENVYFYAGLLNSIAGKREYNLLDRIHPNAAGHALMAQDMWKALKPIMYPKGAK